MSVELTAAEERVVPYMAGRLTIPEIGDLLHISKNTVKTHLRHIYEKVGVSGRGRAAAALAARKRSTTGGEA